MDTAIARLKTAALAAGIAAGLGVPIALDSPDGQPPSIVAACLQVAGIADDAAAVQGFEQRVAGYVALHRLLEGPLPPLEVSNDVGKVREAMDALATRVRAARKDARQGDLFTTDAARVFRRRIAGCLSPEDMDAILAEHKEHEPPVLPRLAVNMTWPKGMPFNFVPPQLIAALPPLPPELQYRIIGRSIVIFDHHANLIVDFLPRAFTT